MKTRVEINRGEFDVVFTGEVLRETDTHYFVHHGVNADGGEWFAKSSRMVNCRTSPNVRTGPVRAGVLPS